MEAALRQRVGPTKITKIPKPKGQVGRDWNLQDRMGLSANWCKYCLVRALPASRQEGVAPGAGHGLVYVIIQTQLWSMLDYDQRCAKELTKKEAKSKKKTAHCHDDIESNSKSSTTEGSDSDTDSLDSESSSSSSDEPVAKSHCRQAVPAQKNQGNRAPPAQKSMSAKKTSTKKTALKPKDKSTPPSRAGQKTWKHLFEEAEITPEGSNSPDSDTLISSRCQCSRHVQEIQQSPVGVDDLFASDLEEEPRPAPNPAKKRATRKRAPPDSDEADDESDDDVPLAAPLKLKLLRTSHTRRRTPDDDTMSIDKNRDLSRRQTLRGR
ncbi:hypothetical protein FA13DRAFT_1800088 [Coprinellus micaceus]|uniref:Uncharacterized protein n=1 Tax=Coprinellus micaceus TaxID=71717 RepID=A0A4Y7SHN5_COPMI|nr:hypothetical protein FA13DRAFT_1800088 [Coprinellus micaceus]